MKLELKPSPKLKNKTTILYTVTSLLAVFTMGCFAFFYFNMGVDHASVAATQANPVIKSKRTGDWNEASTWEGGIVPTSGQATILEGHRVTITENLAIAGDVLVDGILRINAGNTLELTAEDSKLAVSETGKITQNPEWLGAFAFAFLKVQEETYWLGVNIDSPTTGPTGFGVGYEILPIDLLTFDATLTPEKETEITWTTTSEESNDYFTIERSLDGQNFFTLDTIEGAGNSSELKEYAYTDTAPVSGYNYYRLKQTDYDGKSETFDIATVFNDNAEPELSIVSIGPNPYRDHFEINFTSLDNSFVHMKISDMQGRTIFAKSLEAEKGLNSFTYVDQKGLQPGVYLFTIVQKGTPAKTYRIVKDS